MSNDIKSVNVILTDSDLAVTLDALSLAKEYYYNISEMCLSGDIPGREHWRKYSSDSFRVYHEIIEQSSKNGN